MFGSPSRLLQLITNLIENAVDASPDGGVVEVRMSAAPDTVVLEVQDHGAGIPVEKREFLFKPLFTTKQDGTGLGLAISRRIATQHEGSIEFETRTPAESPSDHGSTFRVTLPSLRREKEVAGGD